MLKKVQLPETLDDTRAISKSPFLCTIFEKIVVKWLLEVIGPKIDWAQYGGVKGCSISHLMSELVTYIMYNLDIKKKQGVILTAIDYSKAFNRQSHNNFLILLWKMGVPGWLLNIILGFLRDRKMVMSFNDGISNVKNMPGGGPAGTTLGLIMFVVLINGTANPGEKIEWGKVLSSPVLSRKPIAMTHGKMIDDASILESVPMQDVLIKVPDNSFTRPVIRRERLNYILPDHHNKTQAELEKVSNYADKNFMQINKKKSKIMFFNPGRRKLDFQPRVKLNNEILNVTEQMRLVGLILTDDLKWKKIQKIL